MHARVRPLLEREKDAAANASPVYQVVTNNTCNFMKNPGEVKALTFDTVFEETSSQSFVYDKVAKNIIDGVLSGYNGTLFAYGQTGTGKTHTMMGADVHSEDRGIIPRSLDHIFQTVSENSDKFTYELNMSYVQLYCELLQDLLEPDFSKTLAIREDTEQGRGVYIEGISSFNVESKDECLNLLRIGHENRAVAETKMNAQSSRSHAAFMLTIERRPKASFDTAKLGDVESKASGGAPKKTFAKLFIVDLAGSERVKTAGTMHGQRFSELKSINLSLSALGNCINALAEKKRHIPFRDSKLTRLLQDSLGGNARTSLVINVNPCPTDANETFSSLMFGQRAMNVETKAKRNVEVDYKALYSSVQTALDEKDDEIHRLQIELANSKQMVDRLLQDVAKARSAQQSAEMRASTINAVQSSLASISRPENDDDGDEGADSSGGGLFLTAYDAGTDDNKPSALTIEGINKKWTEQIEQLQQAFEKQLDTERKRSESQIEQCKTKTAKAEDMWNTIEYDLRGEREEHLRTCLQLKECRIQLNELDKETTERISELTADINEMKAELETAKDGGNKQAELAQALKDSTKSVRDVREGYRKRAQDLEAVYCEKIEWLTEKVEQLERRRTQENQAPPPPAISRGRLPLPGSTNRDRSRSNNRRSLSTGRNTNRGSKQVMARSSRALNKISTNSYNTARASIYGKKRAGGGGAGAAKVLRSSRTEAQMRREKGMASKKKSTSSSYGGGSLGILAGSYGVGRYR